MNMRRIIIVLAFLLFGSPGAFAGRSAQDSYEPDDTFQSAYPVSTAGEVQHHNFHKAGDIDWLIFYGFKDEPYTVKIENAGMQCNPVLELYDIDGTTRLRRKNDGFEGENEIISWQCPAEGIYYVKSTNFIEKSDTGETGYTISVYKPTAPLTGDLTGTVKDTTTGRPVKKALVKPDHGSEADFSRSDGYYCLHVEADTYLLSVTAEGYQPFSKNNLSVGEGDITTFDVYLCPDNETCETDCYTEEIYGRDSAEAATLRTFKDTVLAQSGLGRSAISAYYTLSARMPRNEPMRKSTRTIVDALLPFIRSLNAAASR